MTALEGRGSSRRFGWSKWLLQDVAWSGEKEVDVLGLASKNFALQSASGTHHVWNCGDSHGSIASAHLLSLFRPPTLDLPHYPIRRHPLTRINYVYGHMALFYPACTRLTATTFSQELPPLPTWHHHHPEDTTVTGKSIPQQAPHSQDPPLLSRHHFYLAGTSP